MVYTANESRMHRIDPDTGEVEIFINNFGGFAPKVFDWNLDFTQMYIGTNYSGGKLWVVDLDANFDPVGQPTIFVDSVGESWHDAVAVDTCGNIYVAEFWSGGIYRVPPDGSRVDRLIATGNGSQQYGHGIVWGSGIGGWPDTKITFRSYNGNVVIEMDIGVPYRTFTGSVINRPEGRRGPQPRLTAPPPRGPDPWSGCWPGSGPACRSRCRGRGGTKAPRRCPP